MSRKASGEPTPEREKPVGERLVEARESLGLSRAQAAKMTNMNWQYWNDIETGKANPSLEKLWQIATGLGIDPAMLDHRLASPTVSANAGELRRLRELVAELQRSVDALANPMRKDKPQ